MGLGLLRPGPLDWFGPMTTVSIAEVVIVVGVRHGAEAASARLTDWFGPMTTPTLTEVAVGAGFLQGFRIASARFLDWFGPMRIVRVEVG